MSYYSPTYKINDYLCGSWSMKIFYQNEAKYSFHKCYAMLGLVGYEAFTRNFTRKGYLVYIRIARGMLGLGGNDPMDAYLVASTIISIDAPQMSSCKIL
jgi:hypothetical protein